MPSPIRRLLALALPLAALSGTPAAADSNVLRILQEDGGNILTVDQSAASDSEVGGLQLSEPTTRTIELEPATRTSGAQTVDMRVLEATSLRGEPARQTGGGNSADVTISGVKGFVGLFQDSGPAGVGNRATVNLSAGGEALVGQRGANNQAEMTLATGALSGTILQDGASNRANLDVEGTGSSGRISQFGNGLNNGLRVTGAQTSATLIANGVSNAVAGTPVTVESNGASVTITQSPM